MSDIHVSGTSQVYKYVHIDEQRGFADLTPPRTFFFSLGSAAPFALLFIAQLLGLRATLTMSLPLNAEIISEALEA